ncbi:MAG TPA: hypothetical protein EYP17_02160 [Candidatus Latescibacteria bacterium]|nr:hypothetical protein [Candidatus Latescibacterota bacterium]
MRAGVAIVDITPPVGIAMGGFAARKQGAQGVHDPLYARALVLEDGEERLALVTCDLLGLNRTAVARVRELVEEATGMPGERVALCFSHTHSGPAPGRLYEIRELKEGLEEIWGEVLLYYIAGAVRMAAKDIREAEVGVGVGEVVIGVNRRQLRTDGEVVIGSNPKGPIDPQVGVVRINREGGKAAVLMQYACHGVVLGADNLLISADYPGYAVWTLEAAYGGKAVGLFANGCGGNINPKERGNFEAAERLGRALAGEVLKVAQEVRPAEGLKVIRRKVCLPLKKFPPIEEAKERVRELEKLAEETEVGSEQITGLWGELVHARHTLMVLHELRATQGLEVLERGEMESEVWVVRLGDAALVFLPGEVFVEVGLEIRERSPFPKTLVLAYCNDYSVSYVPTTRAYEEGGYEPRWARVAPGADRVLAEAALGLLEELSA